MTAARRYGDAVVAAAYARGERADRVYGDLVALIAALTGTWRRGRR
jgi:hypothetical protein